jgi:hypothetical protein
MANFSIERSKLASAAFIGCIHREGWYGLSARADIARYRDMLIAVRYLVRAEIRPRRTPNSMLQEPQLHRVAARRLRRLRNVEALTRAPDRLGLADDSER